MADQRTLPTTALRAPHGITPDEADLLRRRQEWRAKVLRVCLEETERLDANRLDTSPQSTAAIRSALSRFAPLAQHLTRDGQRLLESEIAVPGLEMHRHGANYFLDHLIRALRDQRQAQHREDGRGPLESLSDDELAASVREILLVSLDSIPVFINNLIRIEEFELEINNQRLRLQSLLGCDRGLRDLAESNADIIEAPLEEFLHKADVFFAICNSIASDLMSLLRRPCCFPGLAEELDNSVHHLEGLLRDLVQPLHKDREAFQAIDQPLALFEPTLRLLIASCEQAVKSHLEPAQEQFQSDRTVSVHDVLSLKTRLLGLRSEMRSCLGKCPTAWEQLSVRPELREPVSLLRQSLDVTVHRLSRLDGGVLSRLIKTLRESERHRGPKTVSVLAELITRLRQDLSLVESLEATLRHVRAVRECNARYLKERICEDMGLIRTTFLQPCFAHIAASDPRSTHSAQYFYLKEFADEARRSQQLLEKSYALWRYIENLQNTQIGGLQFTPSNLNKIAQRVLLERKTVPAGPGWVELSTFLNALKDELVPQLRTVCVLPGVRYDDKNQLTAFAARITEDCGMLLAQRDTAYRLLQRISETPESEPPIDPSHYRNAILSVTCEDMASNLRSISKTLVELVPYIGAMVGGIRMRTSLTFSYHRPN